MCARHLRAGPRPDAVQPSVVGLDPAFDRDVFLLRQRALSIASKYEVWAEDGTPVLYVERPTYLVRTLGAYALAAVACMIFLAWIGGIASARHAIGSLVTLLGWVLVPVVFLVVSMSARPLRHVTVYRDESRRDTLLRVLQDQRWAVLTRTYTVIDHAGAGLARFRKHYVHNVLRKRWYAESPAGELLATAIEDSIVLSLLRRALGPFVGTLFGVLRVNFIFVRGDEEVFGEFNRKMTLLDRYVLDLRDDPERRFDRRIALALGIMLDTGERR